MHFERLTQASQVLDLIRFHNDKSSFVVLDVETTSVNPRQAQLLDVQMSGTTEDSAVIFSPDMAEHLKALKPEILLVAHNYKYDAQVLFRHGVDLLSYTWRDTILIGHLLDENRAKNQGGPGYGLGTYVKEYFGSDYKGEFWKADGGKYESYLEAPKEEREEYACRDVVYTGALYRRLLPSLKEDIPESLITHVHALQASLVRSEIEGIRVDLGYLTELGVKLKHRIDELQPQMRSLVKDEIDIIELEAWQEKINGYKSEKGRAGAVRPIFNFESSQQLVNLLYNKLCLPSQRNEKTRSISTDYSSLEKIKGSHPVVELIQQNRELQKVYSAYVEGTLDRLDQGRIYPEFRVNGTATGRLSHSNPNLAQLPKAGGVRGIYIPDQGRSFISADYSQLEVVLEANLSGDKNLIRMLENGESKHDLTSRELGCSRDTAKTLNFALQYWASHFKVAKLLGVSTNEGLTIWRRYWEIYSGPKELKAQTDRMVDEGTPLSTAFGRKRRFGVRKRHPWDGDYRQAYNFLIQGTGADITSRAFYLVDQRLRLKGEGRGCFTVHDELVVEVDTTCAPEAEGFMLDTMLSVGNEIGLTIPLKAESSGLMERWHD